MKQYLKIVVIPGIIAFAFANIIFPNPSVNNIKQYISKALASGNDYIAEKEYKKLAEADINNIEHHRLYISVHYSLPQRRDDTEITAFYTALARNSRPDISDIGYYGLGLIKYQENDFNGALKKYLEVRNQNLPFLSNSVGRCYLELGDAEKAKTFLNREIELGVNVNGAVYNLWQVFLREHNISQLRLLMENPSYRDKFSAGAKRQLAFLECDFSSYFGFILAFYEENFVLDGIIAAAFICLVWLIFIKFLDVFEPEKFRYLILTLLLSILCSRLAYLLYDFFHLSLRFEMGNSPLEILAYCIFRIGLTEEFVKLVPILLIIFFSRQINESTDYLIYASVSALGFAFMENIGYFDEAGLGQIAGRAISATMFHMALSSFAVYGLIYAKYKNKSYLYFGLSFIAACVVHGLYDFLIFVKGPLSEFRALALFVLLFSVIFYARIFRNTLNSSEFFSDAGQHSSFRHNAFLLVCALSYIVILQYLIISFRFGPVFSNRRIVGAIFGSYLVILVTYSQFAGLSLKKDLWIPIFKSHKKDKTEQSSPPAK